MTDIDLIDLWRTTRPHADWENRAVAFARAVIDATREQIVREIEVEKRAEEERDLTSYSSGKFDGLFAAARIARGES